MRRIVAVFFLSLFFVSCGSGVDIISDYDHEVDFTTYKSFFFLPWNKENSKLVNEIAQRRILAAIASELEARGYARSEAGGDLAVGVNILLDKKTAQRAYTSYYSGGGWGYYAPYGFGVSTTQYQNYDYWMGTLIIDLFDAKEKKLVWQGSAVGTVEPDGRSDGSRAAKIVEQMFWDYPLDASK